MTKQLVGKILLTILPLGIIGLVIFFGIKTGRKILPVVNQSPQLFYQPTPTPAKQSPWANNPTVLEIQTNLEDLSTQLDKVDLEESHLLPPIVDTNIKF